RHRSGRGNQPRGRNTQGGWSMKRVRLWLAVGLVAVAAVAVLGPASSAVGFFSRRLTLIIQVKSPATPHANGVAVDVPLDVVCTGSTAFVDVQVTQRNGKAIAQGFAEKQVACTHDLQGLIMTMAANGAPFKKGPAFVHADIFGCLGRVCGTETADV